MTPPRDAGAVLVRVLDEVMDSQTPLVPEVAMSEMLGMVWAGAEAPREQEVAFFCRMVAEQVRVHGPAARPVLELLARQAPADAASGLQAQADATAGVLPEWVALLGSVELLDACTSMDSIGLQENFIMHFGYRSAGAIVGEHVVIALVDHGLGLLKDTFLVGPQMGYRGIRQIFAGDPNVEVADGIAVGHILDQVLPAMHVTDAGADLSILGEETAQAWHLLVARMRAISSL